MCRRLAALAACLVMISSPGAQAQSVDTLAPRQAPVSAADSAAPGGNGSAAGVATKQGQSVNPVGTPGTLTVAKGVALTFTYIGEAAGNPTGGIKQGSAYSDQIFGGLDFDLKTIVGLDGGFVHFAMVERNGKSDSASFIGNDTAVQEIFGQQKLRLTLFTYQQKFLDGKIDITLGRSGGNDDFLTSPLYCLFESNAICGSPVYIFQVSNFTAFPASGYAGIAKVFLTDKVYLHVGAYAADPENTAPTEIGYNLGVNTATGATIPAEIVYATSFANDRLPRHYTLGAIYDASKRADPVPRGERPARCGDGAALQAGSRPFDRLCDLRPDDLATRRYEADRPVDLRCRLPDDERARPAGPFVRVRPRPARHVAWPRPRHDRLRRQREALFERFRRQHPGPARAGRRLAQHPARAGDVRAELRLRCEQRRPFDAEPAIRAQPGPGCGADAHTTNIPNAFVIGGRLTADLSAVIPQSLFR